MKAFVVAVLFCTTASVWGQEIAPPAAPVVTPVVAPEKIPVQSEPASPSSKVIIEREVKLIVDGDLSVAAVEATVGESSSQPMPDGRTAPHDADVTVTEDEREAVTFTAYDLDLHVVPAKSGLEAHAKFTVRNDGKVPLTRLALQLSSSLEWEALRASHGAAGSFVQHRINTDADHTGVAREAVLTLDTPLAPGAAVELTAIYSGSIPRSAERLERIGAPDAEAAKADWDEISAEGAALRGYGNVLWYPVAGAPVFLGDGAKLFDAVGRTRLRQQAATARLRLTIEYAGDAPDAAYFCGRRELFTVVSDNDNLAVASGAGVATAEFAARPLGFRVPSLFLTEKAATTTDGALIRAVTDQDGVLGQYAAAAAKAQPLLMDWLGTSPLGPLDILELPALGANGQPFEDGALLVTPLRGDELTALAPVMVHTLSHAWFRSSHAWLDEGVSQFMSMLWVETNDGRQAGVNRLQSSIGALALAEPDLSVAPIAGVAGPQGQSLIDAHTEIYYRIKAAAVLWMLRSLTSDDVLKQALHIYQKDKTADASAEGFEKVLEQTSHEDLRWFFDDWVYRDRGLPDLSIAYVAPRPAPSAGGKSGGWLVAVSVRNDGDAVAEVPVTVRSGKLTATERLRIPGRSNAAVRVLFQDTPEEVTVGDGTVPELRENVHRKRIVAQ